MKLGHYVSYQDARSMLQRARLFEFVVGLLEAPRINIAPGSGPAIKRHIQSELRRAGWASPVKVDPSQNPDLNALHQASRTVLQVQVGNIARAFYDLMKMQSLHDQDRAACGVLIVPSTAASRVIGGNLANFDRVRDELEVLYFQQIRIPVLLTSFE